MPPISRNLTYAFLAVEKIEDLGYCGGLLMLGKAGRPVEFHCTAPVNANKAQEILYGATLREFLVCDQIALSLLKNSKTKPDVILVDDVELTKIDKQIEMPVVLVNTDGQEFSQGFQSGDVQISIGSQPVQLFGHCHKDHVELLLRQFVETLPITEPFERIYFAIQEAHKEAA